MSRSDLSGYYKFISSPYYSLVVKDRNNGLKNSLFLALTEALKGEKRNRFKGIPMTHISRTLFEFVCHYLRDHDYSIKNENQIGLSYKLNYSVEDLRLMPGRFERLFFLYLWLKVDESNEMAKRAYEDTLLELDQDYLKALTTRINKRQIFTFSFLKSDHFYRRVLDNPKSSFLIEMLAGEDGFRQFVKGNDLDLFHFSLASPYFEHLFTHNEEAFSIEELSQIKIGELNSIGTYNRIQDATWIQRISNFVTFSTKQATDEKRIKNEKLVRYFIQKIHPTKERLTHISDPYVLGLLVRFRVFENGVKREDYLSRINLLSIEIKAKAFALFGELRDSKKVQHFIQLNCRDLLRKFL